VCLASGRLPFSPRPAGLRVGGRGAAAHQRGRMSYVVSTLADHIDVKEGNLLTGLPIAWAGVRWAGKVDPHRSDNHAIVYLGSENPLPVI